VEEAETGGTTITPGDSEETQFQRASRQKDAEDALKKEFEENQKRSAEEQDKAQEQRDEEAAAEKNKAKKEYEESQKGRAEEKDPYDEAVEKYEAKKLERDEAQRRYNERRGIVDDGPDGGEENVGEDDYVRGPKQDVSDLTDELGQEIGTPLPDDVPTSPNIMTDEEAASIQAEMESTTPGLKGGSEAGMIGEIGGGEVQMIGELGGEAVAIDEGIATAAKIAAAAKAGQTVARGGASIASTLTAAAELAEAGEEAAVATTIITGLASAQGAAAGVVLAAGAEIAALTAVTYAAEKLYDKAEGKVERPDSLDGAAHELTQTERDYFQQFTDKQVKDAQVARGANVDPTQLRRQPISPFAAKGSGVTPGSGPGGQRTPLSIARDRDLYIEMSDAEKKVWDDNYNKTIADEKVQLNYWNNLPEGTTVQNGVDGYVIVPPPTLAGDREPLPGTPQSWIDDFNRQLENDKIPKQQDGIGNLEMMAQDEMAAAQLQKDAEMKEVTDYLAYMDQRNEAYLASVGLLETLPEVEPEPEAQFPVEPDNEKRLQPVNA